ncbi:MAG: DUF72 domain-containing protein [Planctomycetales bacterium]|jgi:uncharacterized protein YecE (DUF72 family)
MPSMSETELQYRLGCPVWACPDWVGALFSTRDRKKWLGEYSSVFGTVEGNSTFYGLPAMDTVKRWANSSCDGFRFCLKFPKAISHDRRLIDAEVETGLFLDILKVLAAADRLGPSFLQLPPTFSAVEFDRLKSYLQALPTEFPYAVEVRHLDFFDQGPVEAALDEMLRDLKIDRVLFDSRPLFSKPPSDEAEEASQARKPRSPHRTTVTGSRPMLRLVGRNSVDDTMPWIKEWAVVIADWIKTGLEPYVFAHSPDEAFAPEFAARLHSELQGHLSSLPSLATWPGRKPNDVPRQLSLFG